MKVLDADKYGALCASTIPKVIETEEEFRCMREALEHLTFRPDVEQRGLRQADLVPVLGTRAQVSEVISGKRGISKAQAKRLAEFFRESVELFI